MRNYRRPSTSLTPCRLWDHEHERSPAMPELSSQITRAPLPYQLKPLWFLPGNTLVRGMSVVREGNYLFVWDEFDCLQLLKWAWSIAGAGKNPRTSSCRGGCRFGQLLCGGDEGWQAFSESGARSGSAALPTVPTGCAFAGARSIRDLFVVHRCRLRPRDDGSRWPAMLVG